MQVRIEAHSPRLRDLMDSKGCLTPFLKNAAEISPSVARDYLQTRDEECIISLPPINPQGGNLFLYYNPGKEGTYNAYEHFGDDWLIIII